jgi:hypothetical protein
MLPTEPNQASRNTVGLSTALISVNLLGLILSVGVAVTGPA